MERECGELRDLRARKVVKASNCWSTRICGGKLFIQCSHEAFRRDMGFGTRRMHVRFVSFASETTISTTPGLFLPPQPVAEPELEGCVHGGQLKFLSDILRN